MIKLLLSRFVLPKIDFHDCSWLVGVYMVNAAHTTHCFHGDTKMAVYVHLSHTLLPLSAHGRRKNRTMYEASAHTIVYLLSCTHSGPAVKQSVQCSCSVAMCSLSPWDQISLPQRWASCRCALSCNLALFLCGLGTTAPTFLVQVCILASFRIKY